MILSARGNAKFVIVPPRVAASLVALSSKRNTNGSYHVLEVGDGHMKSHLEARAQQFRPWHSGKFRRDVCHVHVEHVFLCMTTLHALRLGVAHAVHFAGSVKSGTTHLKAGKGKGLASAACTCLEALFKSCDAVVVPSRNEPFGIVVLEAGS